MNDADDDVVAITAISQSKLNIYPKQSAACGGGDLVLYALQPTASTQSTEWARAQGKAFN